MNAEFRLADAADGGRLVAVVTATAAMMRVMTMTPMIKIMTVYSERGRRHLLNMEPVHANGGGGGDRGSDGGGGCGGVDTRCAPCG